MQAVEGESLERALLNLVPAAIVVVGASGRVVFSNACAKRLFGTDPTGMVFDELVSSPMRDAFTGYRAALSAIEPPPTMYFEGEFRHADGRGVWIECQGVNLTQHPRVKGLALSLVDASAHRQQVEKLARLSVTDPLTGLGDRRQCLHRLETALRELPQCVVCSIDVDQFKQVNDRFGHDRGDRVLKAFAVYLAATLPDDAEVWRFGGDEFMAMIPGPLTPQLLDRIKGLARLELDGDDACPGLAAVTASIGVTLGGQRRADAVAAEADVAVFLAKVRGRQQAVVYDADAARELDEYRARGRALGALEGENRRLHAEARTDALTGLANRRALAEVEPLVVGNPGSRWATCAVLFIDVDHFGRYNHLYGDKAGDDALRFIADALQASARSTDLVYRKGGEEFVVVLPHTDLPVARAVAQRMRATIARLGIAHADGGPDKRVSILVAIGVVRPGDAVASAVAAAGDEAMRAKSAGQRGCVVESP
ncbi:MAG: diguanylate cyclase [Burkholderiaceae bacterium]|nr:diguanylate cyclase [Burkholderiaceae bacterium]